MEILRLSEPLERTHGLICFETDNNIKPVEYPIIQTQQIEQTIKRLKNKKAAGQNKKKPEMYKA